MRGRTRWHRFAAAVCVPVAVVRAGPVALGCPGREDGEPPGPGAAAVEVTAVRGDTAHPPTVTVTDWEAGPHPQVPERGDGVHFTYRAVQEEPLPEAPRRRVIGVGPGG
ncbi:hypothetical protein [Streptomyces sp. NPDC007904]|jgi:hypothetical protein|uniref:hypothetical protein n=1 Tax=Streptomyces sp. NPDC007904 TaxID=3364787 RepID=UPI0036E6BA11